MTKKDKQLAKLLTVKILGWKELVSLLESLGFEMITNQGGSSHCKLVHKTKGHLMSLCRPHPGNEVKPYMLRQVKQSLKEWGFL